MTKQKKPKTGDVVRWEVIDRDGDVYGDYKSRSLARDDLKKAKKFAPYCPYRLAKVVLA